MIAFLREAGSRPAHGKTPRDARAAKPPSVLRKQLTGYAEVLRDLGATLEFVPPLAEEPTAYFVEDTAVLLPEVSIVARPGAASQIGQLESVVQVLAQHRPLQSICEPGVLDGSDVLRIGRTIYVAASARTNEDGIAQLREIVEPFGYDVRNVTTHECHHLKTACTFVPPHFLVVNPARIDTRVFSNHAILPAEEKEPSGANTLTLARTTLVSASCPKTEKRLREAGVATRRVDISEFEKAGGCMTSLSLILENRPAVAAVNEVELRRVQTADAPAPAEHSSQAIVHGGFAFVSPQTPFDVASHQLPPSSAGEQTEHALRNLAVVLTASGSSLARVVKATLHVAHPNEIPEIEATCYRVFGSHRPVRSVIVNSAMPPGVLVQVEAVAVVGGIVQ